MKISLIAAVARNGVIGNKGKIPWHISEDFKHFKEVTMGHTMIMGQNTFLSIGKPLPGRTNIILTLDKNFTASGCIIAYSPKDAIQKAKKLKENETFIIGGGQIYKLFFPLAEKLYLTKIDKNYKGDTFFPEVKNSEWELVSKKILHSDEENLNFSFEELKRKLINP